MGIQVVGSRLYVSGNTYPIKDQLKSIGCHWDGERRQWWVGKAKQSELESIVNSGGSVQAESSASGYVEPTPEELGSKPCTAKVKYKGRMYFVVCESHSGKLLLTVLDCSMSFWALRTDCDLVKRYEPRQSYGRGVVHQTVRSIRLFIEKSQRDQESIRSGKVPAGYCVDMEDGMLKRRSECDMPSN